MQGFNSKSVKTCGDLYSKRQEIERVRKSESPEVGKHGRRSGNEGGRKARAVRMQKTLANQMAFRRDEVSSSV